MPIFANVLKNQGVYNPKKLVRRCAYQHVCIGVLHCNAKHQLLISPWLLAANNLPHPQAGVTHLDVQRANTFVAELKVCAVCVCQITA